MSSGPGRRSLLRGFGALLAGGRERTGWLAARAASPRGVRWIAFYGESADAALLAGYDLVVLDPMFKGSREAIARGGARLCAYLSLGEIRTDDPLFARLDPAAVLEANPAWPGTRRVDVRHPAWRGLVLETMVPLVAALGFTGLLLDTLDTPAFLERQGRPGMRGAAIGLVEAIREAHPEMLLLVNRGYDLLPDLAGSIDGVVAESLLTTTDAGEAGGHRWNAEAEVAQMLALLAPARTLPILSLDYWEAGDAATIRRIYRRERQLGHHPYVATRMLDRILPEPVPWQDIN